MRPGRQARIERGVGVLEHHLHALAVRAHRRRCRECVMSSPSRRIVPAVGSIRRSSSLPTVDLPQPDLPTRHSVSPGSIAKLTPSTALTSATVRASRPRCSGKCFFRSSTSTTGRHARAPPVGEHALGLVAGDHMAAADRAQRRRLDAAALDRVGAARREGAALDRLAQRRHDAGDLGEAALAVLRPQPRDRGHQAARVGMRRAVEQLGGRRPPRPCGPHTSRSRAGRSRPRRRDRA